MTPWTLDAVGRPTFRHGPWTVTQEEGAVGIGHTDTDIDVSVDADELEVFGEGGRRGAPTRSVSASRSWCCGRFWKRKRT